jgi:hypothetical protein
MNHLRTLEALADFTSYANVSTNRHLLLLAWIEIQKPKLQSFRIVFDRDKHLPSRPKEDLISNDYALGLY